MIVSIADGWVRASVRGLILALARNNCHHQFIMSIVDGRKSKRGRPAVNATAVQVRLPPDQIAALDAWIERQKPHMSRPEAIRMILREKLA